MSASRRAPNPGPGHGSDFLRFEIATVREPGGQWRAFVSRVNMDGDPVPVPDPDDAFGLITLPSRALAEDFAAALVWNVLDSVEVPGIGTGRRIWRKIHALE